jgi:enoyl-CoA hydratase
MLDVSRRDQVTVIRMRHGKANAMDVELCEALAARLDGLRDSPARAVVLTGEGGIFSAGVDLLRALDAGPDYLKTFLPALDRLFETVFTYPGPVVAAINGHAIAGGCVLACAADHRVMVRDAGRMGVPELLVGVPFPTGALQIMRFATPAHRLPSLLHGGRTFSPEEALERGLVDALADREKLLDEAHAAAEALVALPPAAFSLTKRQLREPVLRRIREDGARFDPTVAELWASADARARIRDYVARTLGKGR